MGAYQGGASCSIKQLALHPAPRSCSATVGNLPLARWLQIRLRRIEIEQPTQDRDLRSQYRPKYAGTVGRSPKSAGSETAMVRIIPMRRDDAGHPSWCPQLDTHTPAYGSGWGSLQSSVKPRSSAGVVSIGAWAAACGQHCAAHSAPMRSTDPAEFAPIQREAEIIGKRAVHRRDGSRRAVRPAWHALRFAPV